MTMKRINLYLPEEQLEALEAERVRLGVPVAEQIRRAIDEKLRKTKYIQGRHPEDEVGDEV